jgi:hypothetical protein
MKTPKRKFLKVHLQWHQKIKYFGISLAQVTKDWYGENYKS